MTYFYYNLLLVNPHSSLREPTYTKTNPDIRLSYLKVAIKGTFT